MLAILVSPIYYKATITNKKGGAIRMKGSEKWTREQIKEKLETDDQWLCRGLLAIYKKQTENEKANEVTNQRNGVGFSRIDAMFLTSLAKNFTKWGRLTKGQKFCLRKSMLKYSGQLSRIANKEI